MRRICTLSGQGFTCACVTWLLAAGAPVVAGAREASRPVVFDTLNPAGVLRSVTLDGSAPDLHNPFFKSLGTNGRACISCHVPGTGWTISPAEVKVRFALTGGLDPIFRTNDGSNSPDADVSTVAARRAAFGMLLNKGLIRVGIPMPAGAEFELVGVDDPYRFASASELSLFRRPLPTTNLRFLTAVMWDGRESFGPMGTAPLSATASEAQNMQTLLDDLMHQANDATVGHAQGAPLTEAQKIDIVLFEMNLATAQQRDFAAGRLDARGALGGAEALARQPFFVTINDVLGADVKTGQFEPHSMTLFDAWAGATDPARAAIARGAALFGARRIDITGVGGLNDDLNMKVVRGSCTTCHDAPNVGNHSVALPIDIGVSDASRRTRDMPLYSLRNRATGALRATTDPGRALLTGRWNDVGKFKGPVLRGLASRAPYFHDGSGTDLKTVVDFYDTRFNIGFTDHEKADLVAFLNAL